MASFVTPSSLSFCTPETQNYLSPAISYLAKRIFMQKVKKPLRVSVYTKSAKSSLPMWPEWPCFQRACPQTLNIQWTHHGFGSSAATSKSTLCNDLEICWGTNGDHVTERHVYGVDHLTDVRPWPISMTSGQYNLLTSHLSPIFSNEGIEKELVLSKWSFSDLQSH